jgi:hypothetical protein
MSIAIRESVKRGISAVRFAAAPAALVRHDSTEQKPQKNPKRMVHEPTKPLRETPIDATFVTDSVRMHCVSRSSGPMRRVRTDDPEEREGDACGDRYRYTRARQPARSNRRSGSGHKNISTRDSLRFEVHLRANALRWTTFA